MLFFSALVFVGLLLGMFYWRSKLTTSKFSEVNFDGNWLMALDENGLSKEEYKWTSLIKIEIQSNGLGPFADDQSYIFTFKKGQLTLLSEIKGMNNLIENTILHLPNIQEEVFIEAMGATNKKTFLIYSNSTHMKKS